MFKPPQNAHHRPPDPPEFSRGKEQFAQAVHFVAEVVRLTYMWLMLVCLLTFFGFTEAAGFVTSLFYGPKEFDPDHAYRALLVTLVVAFFINIVQFAICDEDTKP